MQKMSVMISSIILLAYYIFTSGIVYEATHSNLTDRMDVPYSIGLSGERTGLSVISRADDIECAKWLYLNWDKETEILSDYNGSRILNAETGLLQGDRYPWGIIELPWKENSLAKCYIFKTTWNSENDKYIFGADVGLRTMFKWPECNYPIVFQSGKSIIYRTF